MPTTMTRHLVQLNADGGPQSLESFTRAADQLAWLTMENQGLYHGTDLNGDAINNGIVIIDLPENKTNILLDLDYVGRHSILRDSHENVTWTGNLQDGDSNYTGPLEPADPEFIML